MLLMYVSAEAVLFKYLGAESLWKFKLFVCWVVCACARARVCVWGEGRSPVPAWSKACVYRRSRAGIAGSISAGVTCVCVCVSLSRQCVVTFRPPCRADHPSRGVVPNVVCFECDRKAWTVRRPWSTTGCSPWGVRVGVSYAFFKFILCRFYDLPLRC